MVAPRLIAVVEGIDTRVTFRSLVASISHPGLPSVATSWQVAYFGRLLSSDQRPGYKVPCAKAASRGRCLVDRRLVTIPAAEPKRSHACAFRSCAFSDKHVARASESSSFSGTAPAVQPKAETL